MREQNLSRREKEVAGYRISIGNELKVHLHKLKGSIEYTSLTFPLSLPSSPDQLVYLAPTIGMDSSPREDAPKAPPIQSTTVQDTLSTQNPSPHEHILKQPQLRTQQHQRKAHQHTTSQSKLHHPTNPQPTPSPPDLTTPSPPIPLPNPHTSPPQSPSSFPSNQSLLPSLPLNYSFNHNKTLPSTSTS
jgi:hypothetical protein